MIAEPRHRRVLRRALIVSPHFPPVNAPDMQRVRMSLPYCREFGWEPVVLAASSGRLENVWEPELLKTIPEDVAVTRVRPLPLAWTRRLGIGNLALRAFAQMAYAGSRLIREHRIDCVYFSTTLFPAMALGRVWKWLHDTPFVVDIQDPWLSTYFDEHPDVPRPPKYRLAHALDRILEPWTMRSVDGLTAVSDAYIETLRRRYPWIPPERTLTLPFGGSRLDFDHLESAPQRNSVFAAGDGLVHAAYVGRGGHDMAPALRVLFDAIRELRQEDSRFSRLRLHFVGTDYASPDRARETVNPVARECGVSDVVSEQTARVPYFEALQILRDAHLLILIGSDDRNYSPSKIYPYVLAGRPLLAVVHAGSPAEALLCRLRAGEIVTFDTGKPQEPAVRRCMDALVRLCDGGFAEPAANRDAFEPFSAREMTRRLCALLDSVAVQ